MKSGVKSLTTIAFLLALTLVLTIVEGFIPIDVGFAGVKLGLANIIIMFCLLALDEKSALFLVVIKSCFVFITRGLMAFLLSFGGGLLALIIMVILLRLFNEKISYFTLSIAGAMAFNLGQIAVVMVIYQSLYMIYYLPVLILTGVFTGMLTATILKLSMPLLEKLRK